MRGKILILALFACFAFGQAGAQAGPQSHNILSDPNLFADAHIKGLDSQVHLSEEQKAKLRPLFVAEGQKLISIMSDGSLREDQRQQEIQRLHEETAAKVASMLTPSQLKQRDNSPRMPAPQQPGSHQI
jgi:hypothetical protein